MSKTTPKLGVSYPLRIGKTLRSASRSLLSLKFTHVPNNTDLAAPGSLTRAHDKCSVAIPTRDGHAVVFSGARASTTAVVEYALVFANGCMWLERADDVFPGMRPSLVDAAPVPPPLPDNVRGDPDSWMVEESGSPITTEGNEGEEDRAASRAGKSVAAKTVAAKTVVASKGLPDTNMQHMASSSDDDDDDDSDNISDSDDSGSESSQEYTDRSSDED